jgi:hypothetical protein
MANIISEVTPDPEMKSENATESVDIISLLDLENLLDDDAIWVNFGVGGPA